MPVHVLIYPMFAMVLLTAFVLRRMFLSRVRAVREGRLSIGYFATYQGAVEPDYAIKPARHFSNLFEAPVLFYVACVAAMAARTVTMPLVVLAWSYVVARVVHSYVHLGSNRVGSRIRAYFASWLVLGALWLTLVATVALGPSS
jgi:hypothetical protein